MKKICIIFIVFMICLLPVNAKVNRLYFSLEDKKLYYDSKLLDKNIFMNHIDMTPGSKYYDDLVIENETKKDFNLYFKVETKEQSEDAINLLKSIKMKLFFDGTLIYEGNVLGVEYDDINLTNAVEIGNIKSNEKYILSAEVELDTSYTNFEYTDYSYVDWNFYAEFDDSIEVVVPKTDKNSSNIIKIVSLILVLIAVGLMSLYIKNKKNTKKIEN